MNRKENRKQAKFEKAVRKLDIMNMRMNLAQNMMNIKDAQGSPYISAKWITEKILKITDPKAIGGSGGCNGKGKH